MDKNYNNNYYRDQIINNYKYNQFKYRKHSSSSNIQVSSPKYYLVNPNTLENGKDKISLKNLNLNPQTANSDYYQNFQFPYSDIKNGINKNFLENQNYTPSINEFNINDKKEYLKTSIENKKRQNQLEYQIFLDQQIKENKIRDFIQKEKNIYQGYNLLKNNNYNQYEITPAKKCEEEENYIYNINNHQNQNNPFLKINPQNESSNCTIRYLSGIQQISPYLMTIQPSKYEFQTRLPSDLSTNSSSNIISSNNQIANNIINSSQLNFGYNNNLGLYENNNNICNINNQNLSDLLNLNISSQNYFKKIMQIFLSGQNKIIENYKLTIQKLKSERDNAIFQNKANEEKLQTLNKIKNDQEKLAKCLGYYPFKNEYKTNLEKTLDSIILDNTKNPNDEQKLKQMQKDENKLLENLNKEDDDINDMIDKINNMNNELLEPISESKEYSINNISAITNKNNDDKSLLNDIELQLIPKQIISKDFSVISKNFEKDEKFNNNQKVKNIIHNVNTYYTEKNKSCITKEQTITIENESKKRNRSLKIENKSTKQKGKEYANIDEDNTIQKKIIDKKYKIIPINKNKTKIQCRNNIKPNIINKNLSTELTNKSVNSLQSIRKASKIPFNNIQITNTNSVINTSVGRTIKDLSTKNISCLNRYYGEYKKRKQMSQGKNIDKDKSNSKIINNSVNTITKKLDIEWKNMVKNGNNKKVVKTKILCKNKSYSDKAGRVTISKNIFNEKNDDEILKKVNHFTNFALELDNNEKTDLDKNI